jgi:cell division septum initiation protein DivIVA
VSSLKKKFDMATQTTEPKPFATNIDIITDRKADLLVEIESLKRRLSKMDKRIAYHKNKENKFLFFLFTLQNKGIPVNELYEKEGIKDIATSRFADIMAEE